MKSLLPLFIIFMLNPFFVYAEDAVVAKVNGEFITAKDLEAGVDALIPRATYHGTINEEKRNEFRKKALKELIDGELQYQDAVARGMKPDGKAVKEGLDNIRRQFKSKKEYKKALEQDGFTEKALKMRIEKSVLVRRVIDTTVTQPSRVSDDELKQYYAKNTEKFKQPAAVRPRVISTKDENKAKDVLSRLKAGEDFGDIAARVSEDDYRIMGGDMGVVHKGMVNEELEDKVFTLKEGETSGLLRVADKWFIVKVEEKVPELQLSFEESRDKLRQDMEKNRADDLMKKWMDELHAKAKIEFIGRKASQPGDGG